MTAGHREALGSALFAFGLMAVSAQSEARTWRVLRDGSGDAPTIRAALDSAQAMDEILVGPGTYTWESEAADGVPPALLSLPRGITLRSMAGAEATVLDARGQGRVLYCAECVDSHIEGFTLANGFSRDLDWGGGAFLINTTSRRANCTVRECTFRGNEATNGRGGGVAALGVELWDCVFEQNSCGGGGGGVYVRDGLVLGCTVRSNATIRDEGFAFAGGIYAQNSSVGNTLIEANEVRGGVGALAYGAGGYFVDCVIANSMFIRNVTSSGATAAWLTGDCTIRGSIFAGNAGGGPVLFGDSDSDIAIIGCTVVGNSNTSASPGRVAGISLAGQGSVRGALVAFNDGRACGGNGSWSCSNLFGNSTGNEPCGADPEWVTSLDPEFCAVDPVETANFGLQRDSPCAQANHPSAGSCDLIGAADVRCEEVSIRSLHWSQLKQLYRPMPRTGRMER